MNSYYFPHDYNAHNDEKILYIRSKYGMEGYGLYWYFIEKMHESNDCKLTCKLIEGVAYQINIDITLLLQFYNDCIDIELFVTDGVKYWSDRVLKNIETFDKKKEAKSLAGKKGMENRWKNNSVITENNIVISEDNKEKKIKENKIKEYKPTIYDIENEMCLSLDEFTSKAQAEKFFNYYEANGWKVGRNPMKSWKAAVRNWISNLKTYNNEPKSGTTKAESRIREIQQLRASLSESI